MVQVDIPAAFVMGQVYALVAQKSLKKEPSYYENRFLVMVNWYMSLILGPTGLFLLLGWPGWETMYQWGWIETPQFRPFVALFYIFFLMIMVVLGNVGFIFTHWLIRQNKIEIAKILLVFSIILTFSAFIIDIKALFFVGTYEAYHRHTAKFILGSSFIFSWFIIMSYWIIGSILMGFKIYFDDKFLHHQI